MLLWAKHTWKCPISPSVSLKKKKKRCLFLYLVFAVGSRKDCYQSLCKADLGKFSSFSGDDAQVGFFSRWCYRNCPFLVHLFLLRETRAILYLCCNSSWRSQSTIWMLMILHCYLKQVNLKTKKRIWDIDIYKKRQYGELVTEPWSSTLESWILSACCPASQYYCSSIFEFFNQLLLIINQLNSKTASFVTQSGNFKAKWWFYW